MLREAVESDVLLMDRSVLGPLINIPSSILSMCIEIIVEGERENY